MYGTCDQIGHQCLSTFPRNHLWPNKIITAVRANLTTGRESAEVAISNFPTFNLLSLCCLSKEKGIPVLEAYAMFFTGDGIVKLASWQGKKYGYKAKKYQLKNLESKKANNY